MNQKGFINIILVILAVALVGAGAYFVSTRQITPLTQTPTPDLTPTPSLAPSPTPIAPSSPPNIVKPATTSCANLQQSINAELTKVNYCSSDSECSSSVVLIRGEDGEFRCEDGTPNYYHNKNADTRALKQFGQQYAANQCPAAPPGGCVGPREDETTRVVCVKNKCVLTFLAR